MIDASQPRSARGKLPAGILATALIALLAFAPLASAAPDPVGSGSTTVTLNNGWVNYLKTFGIKIQKEGATKLKGKAATFTNTGGSLDPTTGLGEVTLGGGLKFKAGKKTAKLNGLTLNTNKKALFAKVSGKKVKFAAIAGWSQTRNGFGVNLTINKLKLTNAAATQLNKKTGYAKGKPKPFLKNKLIGKGSSEVQPSTVAVVPGGEAKLNLSVAAIKKLAHVGTPPYPEGMSPVAVKAETVAPTTGTLPDVGFPISGGTIGPAANAGTVQTLGGIKLIQDLESVGSGVTTLTMGNIWVDLATKQATVEVSIENPKFPMGTAPNLGNLGRSSIADLNLTGATITSDPVTHTVSVQNATATLQPVTAETLNQVFIEGLEKGNDLFKGQEKFAAGDPLGTFSFTVQTQ